MATAATIAAKLILDSSSYAKDLKTAGSQAESFSSKLSKIGPKLAITGGLMTAGFTTPIVAGFKKITDSASNFSETTNKVTEIFGKDASKDIIGWSKTAATSMGMSMQTSLDAASTFAMFGSSAGIAGSELNDFAKQNTQLAADMASFFNTTPEDAIAAIGAAFRGEMEPIRKYQVLLDDASLRQKAFEMGITESTTKALTPQQKILAAHALIMDKTAKAQGDFARTADGLANSTRINSAEFENISIILGNQLLPYALKIMQFLSGLIDAFNKLTPEQQKWGIAILAVVAAVGPLLTIIGTLATAIGAIIPIVTAVAGVITFPLIAIILVAAGVIALFAAAWMNNWGGIRDKTKPIIDWLVGNFKAFMGVLSQILNFITTYIAPVIASLVKIELAALGKAFDILKGIFDTFIMPYFKAWKDVIDEVLEKLRPFTDFLNNVFGKAFEGIGKNIDGLVGTLNAFADAIDKFKLPGWLGGDDKSTKTIQGINGDTVQTSLRGINMANGGSFIVPSGFPNDTLPVNVSSGERVTVDKNGAASAPFDYDRMALAFKDALLQVSK